MTLRNLDALFYGKRVAVLGRPHTPAQQQLAANIDASIAQPQRRHVTRKRQRSAGNAIEADLAVIMDARWARPDGVAALGEAGVRALLWAASDSVSPAVLRAARPYNLRVLGARTAGIVQTQRGGNISSLPLAPQAGNVALIAQSQSLTAAALDWALGRHIGFSWLACTGAEADIDSADLLDYAALDPGTRAVVLQIGHIRSPRKFMSAARAAARVKPVLVLQTTTAGDAKTIGPDPARSAAFERAGLVECESLGGLFDGLAALALLPKTTNHRVAVLGNGAGVCAVGADAVERQGLRPARLGANTRSAISEAAPGAREHGPAIDLADADCRQTVAALTAATRDTVNADAVLFVHAPVAGQSHAPMVDAIAEADPGPRLLSVWLGLHTSQPARRRSAEARLATFVTADDAVRAVRYRAQHHFTRELLAATPPPDPTVTADVGALRTRLQQLADNGVESLPEGEALHLLTAYGIVGDPADTTSPSVRVKLQAHGELGLLLSVGDAFDGPRAYGLAPLDGLLARRMLAGAGIDAPRMPQAAVEALTQALIRLAKMVVDLPALARFEVELATRARGRHCASGDHHIEITARPKSERARLALSPYPVRMRHIVTLKNDSRYIVRAIHPADEPAVLDLLESLSPEEIRLRFFSYIRHFSHDMAARITQIDYDREVSLTVSDYQHPERLAGLGTIIADPDGEQAEFAVLVHRGHTGVGLGRHLLDCLLRQAGARGIHTVYGDVLAQNKPMLNLARSLGFEAHFSLEDAGSVRVEIDVADYAGAA